MSERIEVEKREKRQESRGSEKKRKSEVKKVEGSGRIREERSLEGRKVQGWTVRMGRRERAEKEEEIWREMKEIRKGQEEMLRRIKEMERDIKEIIRSIRRSGDAENEEAGGRKKERYMKEWKRRKRKRIEG